MTAAMHAQPCMHGGGKLRARLTWEEHRLTSRLTTCAPPAGVASLTASMRAVSASALAAVLCRHRLLSAADLHACFVVSSPRMHKCMSQSTGFSKVNEGEPQGPDSGLVKARRLVQLVNSPCYLNSCQARATHSHARTRTHATLTAMVLCNPSASSSSSNVILLPDIISVTPWLPLELRVRPPLPLPGPGAAADKQDVRRG